MNINVQMSFLCDLYLHVCTTVGARSTVNSPDKSQVLMYQHTEIPDKRDTHPLYTITGTTSPALTLKW